MNIESLKYFIEISKTSSIAKASKSAYVSQQGLSKAIKSLEEQMNLKLFERSRKGITLTRDGGWVLEYAQRIVDQYDEMMGRASRELERLEVMQGEGMHLVVPQLCIITMLRRMQGAGLLGKALIEQAETETALGSIEDPKRLHLLDFPSNRFPLEELEGAYDIVPLVRAKFGIVVRRSLAPKLPKVIAPEQAADLPIAVVSSPTMRIMSDAIFEGIPLKNPRLYSTDSMEINRGVVEGKYAVLTVSLQWEEFAGDVADAREYYFAEIDGAPTDLVAFARPKRVPMSARQREFVEHFKRVFEELRGIRGDDALGE